MPWKEKVDVIHERIGLSLGACDPNLSTKENLSYKACFYLLKKK